MSLQLRSSARRQKAMPSEVSRGEQDILVCMFPFSFYCLKMQALWKLEKRNIRRHCNDCYAGAGYDAIVHELYLLLLLVPSCTC